MSSAQIVADSVSRGGVRLTTMEVVMHRFVLAEFNTHRVFSRNSASSRAIPVRKRLEQVRSDPALPVSWPAEKPGMQGGEELDEDERDFSIDNWRDAAVDACIHAEFLVDRGVHKSVVNRLLEPFLWHTVVVTSTEWDNFFRQRCSPLAQPEIRAVAEAMRSALVRSTPQLVGWREWHRPYVSQDDVWWAQEKYRNGTTDQITDALNRVSVARCARVSYLTHDGKRDQEEDLRLYERLVTADPPHASPLEHVATPVPDDPALPPAEIVGNFRGWAQLRHRVLGF